MLKSLTEEHIPQFGYKVASLLYIKNKLIAVGFNAEKSSPFYAKYGKQRHRSVIWAHAETNAIRQAINNVGEDKLKNSKTTLYVYRLKKAYVGGPEVKGLSKPCKACSSCIHDYNIDKVVYTTDDGYEVWLRKHYIIKEG